MPAGRIPLHAGCGSMDYQIGNGTTTLSWGRQRSMP